MIAAAIGLSLHKRLRLPPFWSIASAIFIFYLPGVQLDILWSTNFIPGFLSLALALSAYHLLDQTSASDGLLKFLKRPGNILALFLSITGFFIYPLTTLFPLVFTFGRVLFSSRESWLQTRTLVIRDIVFFTAAMILYFIIDRGCVQPLILPWLGWTETTPAGYTPDLSINPFEKVDLLGKVLSTSLAGHFHIFLGQRAFGLNLTALCALLLLNMRVAPKLIPETKRLLLQVAGLTLILMLSVAPLIAAKNFHEMGYRLLIAPSAMFVLLFIKLFQTLQNSLASKVAKQLVTDIIIILVGLQMISTGVHVNQVSLNHAEELNLVRKALGAADLTTKDTIIVIPAPRQDASFTGHRFYHEFNYVMEMIDHVSPIIIEEMRKQKTRQPISLYCLKDLQHTPVSPRTLTIDLGAWSLTTNPSQLVISDRNPDRLFSR